jgi:tetratricopeptide (TPR) repeat protein
MLLDTKKLLLVCTFLLFIACGGDYLAEKYLFKANQLVKNVDLQTISDDQFNKIVKAYEIVTNKWPLSTMSADAHFALANMYVVKKMNDRARQELETIILNFSKNSEIASNARFLFGQTYEIENDLVNADKIYSELYEILPTTKRGLMAPIYIAEMYKKNKDIENSNLAYDKALKHYANKFTELSQIKSGAIFKNYIALCYASQGLWNKAIEEWEDLVRLFPDIVLVAPTYLTLGDLYYSKLHERSKAIDAYNKVISGFKNSEFEFQARAKLVQIYFVTGEYDSTIEQALLLKERAQNDEIKAQVHVIIARAYEKKGNWSKAESEYNYIVENYDETVASLKVPLLLAQHYLGEEDNTEAERIYNDALNNYRNVMQDEQLSGAMRENALDMMTMINAHQENWSQIIIDMNMIYLNQNESENKRSRALFIMAFINQNKLNNSVEALVLYEKFINEYPHHPFINAVNKQIEKIKSST